MQITHDPSWTGDHRSPDPEAHRERDERWLTEPGKAKAPAAPAAVAKPVLAILAGVLEHLANESPGIGVNEVLDEFACRLKAVADVKGIFVRLDGPTEATVHTYIANMDRDVEDAVFNAELAAMDFGPDIRIDFRLRYLGNRPLNSAAVAGWKRIK